MTYNVFGGTLNLTQPTQFAEFDSFGGRLAYVKVAEDRPIMSVEYSLPYLAKTDPPCSAVSAIAELLVFGFFLFSRAKTPAPTFTTNRPTSNDVVSRKDMLFGGPKIKLLHSFSKKTEIFGHFSTGP